jgi:hypothetical protein
MIFRFALRLVLLGACYLIASLTQANHFLYTLVKGNYAFYQEVFYSTMFVLSLIVAPPDRSSVRKNLVLLLGPVIGYASGLVSSFLLPLGRGAGMARVFTVWDISGDFFLSPLVTFSWLVGFYFALLIVFFTPPDRRPRELS